MVDSTVVVLVVVSIAFGMMRCCNHVRKAEFAANKRFTMDSISISLTLSTVAVRGTTAGLESVVVLAVVHHLSRISSAIPLRKQE